MCIARLLRIPARPVAGADAASPVAAAKPEDGEAIQSARQEVVTALQQVGTQTLTDDRNVSVYVHDGSAHCYS